MPEDLFPIAKAGTTYVAPTVLVDVDHSMEVMTVSVSISMSGVSFILLLPPLFSLLDKGASRAPLRTLLEACQALQETGRRPSNVPSDGDVAVWRTLLHLSLLLPFFLTPTRVLTPPPTQEETFGPVVGIQRVSSDDEALRLMNDSRYGLTASVWSGVQDKEGNGRRLLLGYLPRQG